MTRRWTWLGLWALLVSAATVTAGDTLTEFMWDAGKCKVLLPGIAQETIQKGNNEYSIYYGRPIYGPSFGGGSDLGFENGTWYSNTNSFCSYPKIGIPAKFISDDYEVFQVVKK